MATRLSSFDDPETFVEWPSIGSLANVRLSIQRDPEIGALVASDETVVYQSKVKLHGSNAAVSITLNNDGTLCLQPQSRTRFISTSDDFCGFAAWVKTRSASFEPLKTLVSECGRVIVFGEWCGRQVQKGVAISSVGHNLFALFAVATPTGIVVEPHHISRLFSLPADGASDPTAARDLVVIPWASSHGLTPSYTLPIRAPDAELLSSTELMSREVDDVEREDPFVKSVYGQSGLGEGLVFYPVSRLTSPCPFAGAGLLTWADAALLFKAKGEKHAVVNQKRAVVPAAEGSGGVQEFAEKCVAAARCEQGLGEVLGGTKLERKDMGKVMPRFLQWVVEDVKKECGAELAASGLTWNKEVQKAVEGVARKWLVTRA